MQFTHEDVFESVKDLVSFWESSGLEVEYIDGHSFVLSQGIEVTDKSVKKYD